MNLSLLTPVHHPLHQPDEQRIKLKHLTSNLSPDWRETEHVMVSNFKFWNPEEQRPPGVLLKINDRLCLRTDEAPPPQREAPDLFETTNQVQTELFSNAGRPLTETNDALLTAGLAEQHRPSYHSPFIPHRKQRDQIPAADASTHTLCFTKTWIIQLRHRNISALRYELAHVLWPLINLLINYSSIGRSRCLCWLRALSY